MHFLYEVFWVYPYLWVPQAVFTVWLLADAYRRGAEGFWFWLILLFQPLGAWVYFFAVKVGDFRGLTRGPLFARGPSLAELRYRAERSPTLASHLALAQRLIERREYEEAAPHLEAALKTEPDHGQLLYSLALCHAGLGRPGHALPLLQRLLDRDPRWSNYVGWRLLIEARGEAGDPAGALGACRQLARLSPTLENQCLLAEHLFAQQQDAEAHGVLERALRDHSFAPGPVRWRNRGWARQARRLQRTGAAR